VQASFDIYAKNPNTNPEEFAARLLAYAKSMFGRNTKKAIAALERILSGPGASLPPTDPYVRAAHYYLAALLADANATPEEITEANRHADAVGVEPDPIFAALVRTMPLLDTGGHFKYPQDAREAGVEGEATISYRINEMGKVEDAVVVESFPVGVFDKSALDIIKDWKYPPVMGDVPVARMWIKFRFTLTQP
jgi:protein TonB